MIWSGRRMRRPDWQFRRHLLVSRRDAQGRLAVSHLQRHLRQAEGLLSVSLGVAQPGQVEQVIRRRASGVCRAMTRGIRWWCRLKRRDCRRRSSGVSRSSTPF